MRQSNGGVETLIKPRGHLCVVAVFRISERGENQSDYPDGEKKHLS